jgi:hypothetical protein
MDGAINIFHNKQKLKQATTIKIVQGILHTENENKQNHYSTGNIKPQEKKRQGIRE